MLLMVRASVPPLEMVRFNVLVCPAPTLPKLREEGTEIMGCMPVPLNVTVVGEFGASCVMLKDAERVPEADGVRVMVIS